MGDLRAVQGDFFSTVGGNGYYALPEREYGGKQDGGVQRSNDETQRNQDTWFIKAVVVQIGFYRPSVRFTVEVPVNSILLKRVSERWKERIKTSPHGTGLAKATESKDGIHLVFGIPKEESASSTHPNDLSYAMHVAAEEIRALLGEQDN